MKDRLIIFDTTLRDGEQSPGASMTRDEKMRIARQLERLRVDVIEAGFPAASNGDFEAVKAIADTIRESIVCGLARANDSDVRRAGDALKDAAQGRIHTFIATSPIHMERKLRMPPDAGDRTGGQGGQAGAQLPRRRGVFAGGCRALGGGFPLPHPGAGDQGRGDARSTFLTPSATPCRNNSVRSSALCASAFRTPTRWCGRCTVTTTSGLAVANSVAAVMNGARQVECTVNGLGERAGNASLEEIVMAVRTRQDFFPCDTRIDTTQIVPASKLVSGITGFPVQPNKAIVGANAFAHESGIHQDGVIKSRETYEIMRAEDVGWSTNKLVLGKLSGRNAFKQRLKELGIELDSEEALNMAFAKFKDLADKKSEIFDEDLQMLVSDEAVTHEQEHFKLLSMMAHSETGETPWPRW